MGPDLVLTAAAVERLWTLLEEDGQAGCKLRIEAAGAVDDPTYTFALEEQGGPEDVELDYVDVAVLLDPDSRDRLRGFEVDYRRDSGGEYFVIRAGGLR